MINSTAAVQQSSYVTSLYKSSAVTPAATAPAKETQEVKDTVSLSPGADVVRQTIADFPPIELNPEVHFKNAEAALDKLLDRYGIGAGTPVDITVNSRGEFEVKGDHPMLTRIEEDLNSGEADDLRNALIGGHTGLLIGRIAAASQMASAAADQNPAGTDMYYSWVKNVASEAKNSSLAFSYSGNGVETRLMNSRGEDITGDIGLTIPV